MMLYDVANDSSATLAPFTTLKRSKCSFSNGTLTPKLMRSKALALLQQSTDWHRNFAVNSYTAADS